MEMRGWLKLIAVLMAGAMMHDFMHFFHSISLNELLNRHPSSADSDNDALPNEFNLNLLGAKLVTPWFNSFDR